MRDNAFIQNEKVTYTLNEFLSKIKKTLENKFSGGVYWVHGELSDWKYHGVHYYGELIEYDESSNHSIAKIRVNLWARVAKKIISKFHYVTREEISSGMKVLLLVNVNFHTNYGLSLNIIDIDPSFTLGDREARKKKIIENLVQMGIAHNNKKLPSPRDFFRVAVISSETAAGLGDFFSEAHLLKKRNLCDFEIYKASMQGKDCPLEVASQLRAISKLVEDKKKQYDVIVLIRGGGSQADLDWFNNLEPAQAICHMQIPVFVGIGHERDRTILDSLANCSFDTPSKVINYIANTIVNNAKNAKANFNSIKNLAHNLTTKNKTELMKQGKHLTYFLSFFLERQKKHTQENFFQTYRNAKQQLKYHRERISYSFNTTMRVSKNHIELLKTKLWTASLYQRSLYRSFLERHKRRLLDSLSSLSKNFNSKVLLTKNKIEGVYKNILSLAIEPTLKRGFTLTESKGKYITSAREAVKNKELTIIYHDGRIQTEVKDDKTIK